MGRDELKWHHRAHHKLRSQHEPHFSPHSTAKTNDKSTFLVSISISDVVIASVHSEKTRLKKLMMKLMMNNYYYE